MAITKVTSGLISADASSIDLNIDAGTLYLDVSENRVGIGTTSPAASLDVTSAASDAVFLRSSNATTSNVYITNTNATTGNTANLYFAPANNVAGSQISSIAIEDFSSSANRTADLAFSTRLNGTMSERMRIDSSGKLLVGATSNTSRGGSATKALIKLDTGESYFDIQASGTSANSDILFSDASGGDYGILGYQHSTDSMLFYTASTERMSIDSVGEVSIKRAGSGSSGVLKALNLNHAGTSVNDGAKISFTAGTSTEGAGIASTGQAYNSADLRFYAGGDTERMRIYSNGDVAIGNTTASGAKFYVLDTAGATEASPIARFEGNGYSTFLFLDGNAAHLGQNSNGREFRIYSGSNEAAGVELAAGATSWSTYSDERLKENIQDIGSVTDKIKDIRCVTFNRNDVDDENKDDTIGFIAQDFVGKFDQVLRKSKLQDSDDAEEYYSIKYTETIPVLLKAIQEQQTIIDDLKTRIETLENA